MGRLVYGMMQSLDGYVDGVGDSLTFPPPGPLLTAHFQERARHIAGCLYGRRMYEVMRYWDDDQPDWDAGDHAFAAIWRAQPKWVISTTLTSVENNATLVRDDLESRVRQLKRDIDGEIDVAGPTLAATLTDLGLIDEYRLYLRPLVLGDGKAFFARARPALRVAASDRIGDEAVLVTCVPV